MINTLMFTEGALIGTFEDVTVKILCDDIRVPHVHLYWEGGKGVILLSDINASFSHSIYKDHLSESKFVKFQEWLKMQHSYVKNCTNFGYIVSLWGMVNNTLYYGNVDNTIPLYIDEI